MNTILKNFVNVLKHFKMASFLNIAGLCVAFAAFMVIIMQVKYERSFDRSYSTADRIFRVDMPRDMDDKFRTIITRGFSDEVFASSPHIEAGSILNMFTGIKYLTVGEGENRTGFRELVVTCYPSITEIFGFEMIEGASDCLKDPEKVIIPKSMAHRMFGEKSAIGQKIHSEDNIWTKGINTLTVGGVYKDITENSQLDNVIYTGIDKSQENDFMSQNFLSYVLLDSPDSREVVEENFNRIFDFAGHDYPEYTHLELIPVTDIYYMQGQLDDVVKAGNPNTIKLLLLIAFLVITIACINFTNFSTALAPVRMKSINTQKVLGSSSSGLRSVLVFEAIGMSLIACLLAFLLVMLLNKMNLFSFIIADLNISHHIPLIGIMLFISLIIGIIAGLYPAWYMTSFPPALVLKGSFGLSTSGRKLRTALIGFQYIVSIGLIIGSLFIQLQNNYMRNYNLGFDKDHVAMVNIGTKMYAQSKDILINKLKEYPGIKDVAFSTQKLGSSDAYTSYDMQYKNQTLNSQVIEVSPNFLTVMNIPIVGGRNFSETDAKGDSTMYYIFDHNLQAKFDMEPGEYMNRFWTGSQQQIVGFTGDVKLTSLRQENDQVAFLMYPKANLPISYIKLQAGANVSEAVEHIRQTIHEIDSALPFEIEFYDSLYDQLYKKENALNKMITLFSILAIIISIVGVFGLVMFETQYRRKEIGVRKVFGATVSEIITMFNSVYIRIVIICFVIAAPVAWYLVKNWLGSFSFRTPIYWWVFALAFLLVAVITLVTITFQNWQAATENPINSIKSE